MSGRVAVIPGLEPAGYARHSLHGPQANWVEKNCYVDLWIEALHALRLEPLAVLPFAATVDFEGDQWTFFKPSHEELYQLFGVNVQELTVWKPLVDHVIEHVGRGKLIATEADAWWLPDTAGTDYRHQHTKTTIVINDIDLAARRLGYFHNAGYFQLEGEDFAKTFRLGLPADPNFLPLFAETVRIDRIVRHPVPRLVELSLDLWRRHLPRLPADNPVPRFRERFEADLPDMQQRGLGFYHAWAFAATRQVGAAFELAAANLRWLQANGVSGLDDPTAAFEEISSTAKTFILKGARAVSSRRAFDGSEMFAGLAAAWERGTKSLRSRLACT